MQQLWRNGDGGRELLRLLRGSLLYLEGHSRQTGKVHLKAIAVASFPQVTATIDLSTGINALAISPDARFVYAAMTDDSVSVIDTSTHKLAATVPVGMGPSVVRAADGRAYVVNHTGGSVSVIGLSALRLEFPRLFAADAAPSSVVKEFFASVADESSFRRAVEKHYSAKARAALDEAERTGALQLVGGYRGLWQFVTKGGQIRDVEILRESVAGDEATLRVQYKYRDGSFRVEDMVLVRERRAWKIDRTPPR